MRSSAEVEIGTLRKKDEGPRAKKSGVVRRLRAAIVAFLFICPMFGSARTANAWVTRTESFAVVPVGSPPAIPRNVEDLEGEGWSQAFVARDFIDFATKTPALAKTSAHLVYDRENIYVTFVCEQPAGKITAQQRNNSQAIALDDWVAIGLDTSGNGSRIYTFTSNPLGFRDQSSTESSRYAPAWSAAGTIDGNRWMAEMTIPLKILRAESGPKQTWRINFARHVASEQRDLTWAYDASMTEFSDATWWPGFAVGLGKRRPLPHVDFFGLNSLGSGANQFEQTGQGFTTRPVRHGGVDATYPLTSTLSFVGTLWPDYSNVEIDQTSLAPQQFARRLTEYRPFFAQGAGFFTRVAGDNEVLYSRSIGPFDRGFKVEGTQGLFSLSALQFSGTGFGGDPEIQFNDLAFGMQHTTRDGTWNSFAEGVRANHTEAADTTFAAGSKYRNVHSGLSASVDAAIESGFAFEKTGRRRDLDSGLARSVFASAGMERPNLSFGIGYRSIGPAYAPLDGFTETNDVRGPSAFFTKTFTGRPDAAWRTVKFSMNADRLLDRSGAVRLTDTGVSVTALNRSLLSVGASIYDSRLRSYDEPYPVYLNPQTFRYRQNGVTLGYRESTSSPLSISYSWGPFAQSCGPFAGTEPLCKGSMDRTIPINLRQFGISGGRQIGAFSLSGEASNSRARAPSGTTNNPWLLRLGVAATLHPDETLSLSLRTVRGTGAFARPGFNFATGYHRRFANGNELFVVYGTPAAATTLDRLIVKYLLRIGAAGI